MFLRELHSSTLQCLVERVRFFGRYKEVHYSVFREIFSSRVYFFGRYTEVHYIVLSSELQRTSVLLWDMQRSTLQCGFYCHSLLISLNFIFFTFSHLLLYRLPVYPVDVVKTLIQANDGTEESSSAIDVSIQLFQDRGIGAFFDGITPKMLRAAVNHSVTFFIYDFIFNALTSV